MVSVEKSPHPSDNWDMGFKVFSLVYSVKRLLYNCFSIVIPFVSLAHLSMGLCFASSIIEGMLLLIVILEGIGFYVNIEFIFREAMSDIVLNVIDDGRGVVLCGRSKLYFRCNEDVGG